MKIVIDAGHGGHDAGAVNGGLYEKAAALKVAKMIAEELERKGHKVAMTRNDDTFVELSERCAISNKFGADYFISIHCNSSENKTAQGIETWYCQGSSNGNALATSVQNQLAKIEGAKNRGVKAGTFYVLRNTKAPAILIELGFISNEDEKKKLFKQYYQDQLTEKIVKGILNHLG